MALAQKEDVVEAFSSYRADEPFREGILPRAAGGREDLLDPHALHAVAEGVTVDRVAIAEVIGGERCRPGSCARSAGLSMQPWDAR